MYINAHTHRAVDDSHLELLSLEPGEAVRARYYSRGIHPWHVSAATLNDDFSAVQASAQEAQCLAIGECGLDKLSKTPFDLQQKAFLMQVDLANEVKKPVVVHCVKAFSEMLSCLNMADNKMPVIIHGFNNREATTSLLLNEGCFFSFGKALLGYDSNASKALRTAGRRRIFLETDNAEVPIEHIYEKAAQLLGVSSEIVLTQIQRNFEEVFNVRF